MGPIKVNGFNDDVEADPVPGVPDRKKWGGFKKPKEMDVPQRAESPRERPPGGIDRCNWMELERAKLQSPRH